MTKPTSKSLQTLALRLMKERVSFVEQEVGEYKISQKHHTKGDKITLVSARESMFSGLPVTDLVLSEDLTVNWLDGPDGSWMSDQPCELIQMWRELASHARGRVLIGGLGLGVVARMASLMPKVTEIVVVENSPEVITLVGDSAANPKIEIVQADLHEYVKNLKWNQFNTALLDIWQGTGEWVWQTEVVPLRRLIGGTINKVYCWQETTMLNQVADGLFRACDLPVEMLCCPSHCHWYAFRRACVELKIRPATPRIVMNDRSTESFQSMIMIQEENKKDNYLRSLIQSFFYVGTSAWENIFGTYWDEAWKKEVGRSSSVV